MPKANRIPLGAVVDAPGAVNNDPLLNTLRDTFRSLISSEVLPDVSLRHLALLTICYTHEEPQTIKGMSESMEITRSTISRGVDVLVKLGFLNRIQDESDRRNVWVVRTQNGMRYVLAVRRAMQASMTTNGDPRLAAVFS